MDRDAGDRRVGREGGVRRLEAALVVGDDDGRVPHTADSDTEGHTRFAAADRGSVPGQRAPDGAPTDGEADHAPRTAWAHRPGSAACYVGKVTGASGRSMPDRPV